MARKVRQITLDDLFNEHEKQAAKHNTAAAAKMGRNVKTWYHECFETDPCWEDIRDNITFGDIWNKPQGADVYNVIFTGYGDSLVRERIFDEIATITGRDYETVYDTMFA